MFKISNKPFHQRTALKPIKDTAIYEEEEEEEEEDTNSSCHSLGAVTTQDTRKETMLLAQFLSSTGPEEYMKQENKQQFKRASRLLSKLRKKPTIPVLRSNSPYDSTIIKKNHIPLPVYEPPPLKEEEAPIKKSVESVMNLRDSGIYSEPSDSSVTSSSCSPPPPPLPHFDLQQFPQPPFSKSPKRPTQLPIDVASAAIAACSIRSVPEAALKRKSVRLRHVQVQTESNLQTEENDKQACPHCRLIISPNKDFNRLRRPSCPPALSSGRLLLTEGEDAKALWSMIHQLKSQLAEEKQNRLVLEKQIYQRQSEDRIQLLEKEKDKWFGDCLWLNDRIGLLPE